MHSSWKKAVEKSIVYKKLADKYQSPKGYAPWNDVVRLFSIAGNPENLRHIQRSFGLNEETKPVLECGVGAITAATLDAPAIYVERNLTEAILCTEVSAMEPPELVLPAFFICLPCNTLFDDEGEEITSLLVLVQKTYLRYALAMSDASLYHKANIIDREVDHKNLNNLRVYAYTSKKAIVSITHGWDTSTVSEDDTSPIAYPPFGGDAVDTVAFRQATSAMMRIVKNVILIYNYQKNYIETIPTKTSGLGFTKEKKGKKRNTLPVTLLGRNFLLLKESCKSQQTSPKGGTVRPHWRKGHWHTVLTGAGRKERKLRWFQPVYVNPTLDT
jgi:hypothetical protein